MKEKADRQDTSALQAESFRLGSLGLIVFELPCEAKAPENFNSTERDILKHLLAGRTNALIAKARGTSASTIANQLSKMYQKAGVKSRKEMIVRAMGLS